MTSTNRSFKAFVPLSNWLLGFDRYRHCFDKSKLPSTTFPKMFYVLAPDAPPSHVALALRKTQDLIKRLGHPGDRVVQLESELPLEGAPLCATPNTSTGTGIGWQWPSPQLPIRQQGWVDEQGHVQWVPAEAITAAAFALSASALPSWQECRPRSFSVLPIAQACNAACSFCFSKASVSDAIIHAQIDLPRIAAWAKHASSQGAQRAVITGGGEPTLLAPSIMTNLIATLSPWFDNILLITNGSRLVPTSRNRTDQIASCLQSWRQAGLTRVAVSRHGTSDAHDAALMGLAVNSAQALSLIHQAQLDSRVICVLQRGGVQTSQDVWAYLHRARQHGVHQVCFKELYVSSLSENPWATSKANLYSQANQVPLSMVVDALEQARWSITHTLPWGSPVYAGQLDGQPMQVAVYTEPSVGWERSHALVRSWNMMSDGQCLASLEDPASILDLPSHHQEHLS